jgi:hypothetical protein
MPTGGVSQTRPAPGRFMTAHGDDAEVTTDLTRVDLDRVRH